MNDLKSKKAHGTENIETNPGSCLSKGRELACVVAGVSQSKHTLLLCSTALTWQQRPGVSRCITRCRRRCLLIVFDTCLIKKKTIWECSAIGFLTPLCVCSEFCPLKQCSCKSVDFPRSVFVSTCSVWFWPPK